MQSVNLLPPKYKKLQRANRTFRWLKILLISFSVLSLIYGGATYGSLRFLTNINNQKIDEINKIKEEITKFSATEKQIHTINNRLMTVAKIKQPPDWEPILAEIANFTPETVRLTTLNFDQKESDVKISGIGISRRAVVEYQLVLESSPKFKNVEIVNFGSVASELGTVINFSIHLPLEQ